MADALLSDLCRTCYSSPPKYKCPRCSTQTCSLPCYKKHQQRAACNGVRDPAAYLKKSQWATPAGIDRDYNYLRGVEQRLERASADVQDRGIGVRPALSKNIARGLRPDSVLQRYLAEHAIGVERAPVGMSRQKTNRTRPTKRGNVVWSVEWCERGRAPEVQHDCMESVAVGALFDAWSVERRNRGKGVGGGGEQGEAPSRGTKRKREVAKNPAKIAAEVEGDGGVAENATAIIDASNPTEAEPLPLKIEASQDAADQSPSAEHLAPERCSKDDFSVDPKQSPLHFYLLQPNTATSTRVLHPLSSEDTLTQALRHRVVQEYPTIYVLPQAVEDLPSDFTLASAYQAAQRDSGQSLQQRSGPSAGPGYRRPSRGAEAAKKEEGGDADLDPQAVLEMLRRDVTK